MPSVNGGKWLNTVIAGATPILVAAGVLGVFQMSGDISDGRVEFGEILGDLQREVSLYSTQLANTEKSFQASLAGHMALDAHKDAGLRIRAIENRLGRIEERLIVLQGQVEALKPPISGR